MLSAVSRRGPLGPVALVGAVVLPVDLGLSSFPQRHIDDARDDLVEHPQLS